MPRKSDRCPVCGKPAMPEQLTAALKRVEDQSRREVKSVLIVEDDVTLRDNLLLLLKAEAVELVGVGSINEALRMVDALQSYEKNGEACPADWQSDTNL